jgi:hypothetical protein
MEFTTTAEGAKRMLEEHGVAIVPSVLSKSECIQMQEGMWNTLECLTGEWDTPVHRSQPESWVNMLKLYPNHSMLHQHHGIGHAPFVWNVRQHPACVNVFSHLWSCDDLICSFDGASFHMPHEITGRGSFRKPWLHVDQSYTRNDFECIQGWVTAYEVRPGDATLMVLPKSHLYHKDIANEFNLTDKDDWFKLTDEHVDAYRQKGCEATRIVCPRGSMVLWDSRTVHCGVEPLKDRATPNFRCVVYTCYTPRSMATPPQLEKRKTAFESGRMTTHWPHHVKLFGKQPRTYGGDLLETTPLPPPTLTEVGRRLVGY